MQPEHVTVTLLGSFAVVVDGEAVGPGPEVLKPRALLTSLALAANRVVTKDRLVDDLWDGPPASARNLVEKYVSLWRKHLGQSRLETVGQGYRLVLTPEECDLLASLADAERAQARLRAGDEAGAEEASARALEPWRSGADDADALALPDADRRRLADFSMSVLESYAALVLARGGATDDLLGRLRDAVRREPLRERSVELLLWALFQRDRQADALAAFDELRVALDEQLGQEPGQACAAMRLRILRQDPGLRPSAPRAAPTISNLPRRHRRFVGRAAELGRLDELIHSSGDAGGASAVAVIGLVGSGKSALALEYAHSRAGKGTVAWWLDASSTASLATGIESLAHALGVAIAEDTDVGLLPLWKKLDEHPGWLLVFDGAASRHDVENHWPRAARGGVVVTSLNPSWNRVAETLPLDLPSETEAAEILGDRESLPTVKHELVEALGRLPLALSQAAAFMDETGLSAEAYLPLFLRRRRQLLERGIPEDHAGTIEATWRLASAELAVVSPAGLDLLALASQLAAENISLEFLRGAPDRLPADLRAAVLDEVGLEESVASARRYSLLSREGDLLRMHLLVQDVVSSTLSREDRSSFRHTAVELLHDFVAAAEPSDEAARRWDLAGPHLLSLASDVADGDDTPELVALLRRASAHYLSRGTFATAVSLLDAALALTVDDEEPGGTIQQGRILTELGTALEQNGRYRDALAAQERSVAILQRLSPADDPWVAQALAGLGSVLTCHLGISLWRPDELPVARERLAGSLRVLRDALGNDDPVVARTTAALGQVVQDLGDIGTALGYFEESVSLLQHAYGSQHPETARARSKLAFALALAGRLDESALQQRDAIESLQRTFGVDDLEVGWPVSNLGLVALAQGEAEASLAWQDHAIRIFAAADPDGAAVQVATWRAARALRALGREAEADARLERAIVLLGRVMAPDHHDLAGMVAELASIRGERVDVA